MALSHLSNNTGGPLCSASLVIDYTAMQWQNAVTVTKICHYCVTYFVSSYFSFIYHVNVICNFFSL